MTPLSLRSIGAVLLVVGLVVIGCRSSLSEGEDSPAGQTVQVDDSVTSLDAANGFFVSGGHDLDGVEVPQIPDTEDAEEGEETQSHFRAIQVDPAQESTAGAKFIQAHDMDGDGDMDLVSGHNQSLPIQLHLQEQDADGIRFRTVQLAGNFPIAVIAGVEVADMDQDGRLDIVVLVKATGSVETCNGVVDPEEGALVGMAMVLFQPATDITDGDAWVETIIETSYANGQEVPDVDWEEVKGRPEFQGYTALAVGDVTGDAFPDVLIGGNVDSCGFERDGDQAIIDLYENPGATSRSGVAWPDFVSIRRGVVYMKDIALEDVDGDGFLDCLYTRPIVLGGNIRWLRNPGPAAATAGFWTENRPIGNIDPSEEGADVMELGDLDGDGFNDVLVRAGRRSIVQWFRRPTGDDSIEPVFPPNNAPLPTRLDFPWQVFTIDDFSPFRPAAIAIGDLTNDGLNNVVVAVGGALWWYDPSLGPSVFHTWSQDFVLDDTKENGTTDDPTDVDFNDTGTLINDLLVVDMDGDGVNDVVATFDRRVDSGLADDEILWFRNTLFDEQAE